MRNEKVAMEDRLTLRATAPWLSVPSALMLASDGRNFEIQVGAAGVSTVSQTPVPLFTSMSPDSQAWCKIVHTLHAEHPVELAVMAAPAGDAVNPYTLMSMVLRR